MSIKRISTIALAYVAAALLSTGALMAQSPAGLYKTIDDETGKAKSHVLIYEYQGKFYGKVQKILDPSRADAKCTKCSGNYKDKPIQGMVIMWNMKKDGNEYTGGQILDPNKGKTYTCKFWTEGNTLKVRGYLGPFYRTQTWYKLN